MPFSPVTPILGVGFCAYMLFSLGTDTWVAFGGWMAVGLVIYWLYGIKNSKLNRRPELQDPDPELAQESA